MVFANISLIKAFNSLVTLLNAKRELLLCPSIHRHHIMKPGDHVFLGILSQLAGFHSIQQLTTRSLGDLEENPLQTRLNIHSLNEKQII